MGKGFDDRQWRKFHRILSQPIGSELHSVESRPYRLRPEGESRHFDSPGHCKSMLPGFCFSYGFSGFFRFAFRNLNLRTAPLERSHCSFRLTRSYRSAFGSSPRDCRSIRSPAGLQRAGKAPISASKNHFWFFPLRKCPL